MVFYSGAERERVLASLQAVADVVDQESVLAQLEAAALHYTIARGLYSLIRDLQDRDRIDRLRASNQRREYFDGKKLLDEFYRRHLHSTGMSKEIFVYECARCAADRRIVKKFVDELFDSIAGDAPTDE